MVFSRSGIVNHHTIGANQPVYERLNRHTAHADLGIGNKDARLHNIAGNDLRRQPRIYRLEIHLAFSNLTAFNPHIRHFGKNRKHSFCNFGIIDSSIPFGEERPRVAVQRAHHSLLRGHREPAVHVLCQQFGILCAHLIIIFSRDAKRRTDLTMGNFSNTQQRTDVLAVIAHHHLIRPGFDESHLQVTSVQQIIPLRVSLALQLLRQFHKRSSIFHFAFPPVGHFISLWGFVERPASGRSENLNCQACA